MQPSEPVLHRQGPRDPDEGPHTTASPRRRAGFPRSPDAWLRATAARACDAARSTSLARDAPIGAACAIGYVIIDWLTYTYEWSSGGFTLWNPPPALGLALLLTRGFRFLPWVFVADVSANLVVRGIPGSVAASLCGSGIMALGYAALAQAMSRIARLDLMDIEPRDLAALLAIAPVGVLLIAAVHVQAAILFGLLRPEHLLEGTLRFWIGDVTGVLTALPILLLLMRPQAGWRAEARDAWLDIGVFLLATIGAVGMVFVIDLPEPFRDETRYLYLLFPPIVWLAIRRGILGAALGVLVVETGVFLGAVLRDTPRADFEVYQLLAVILTATGLLLGATITWRRNAEAKLRAQRDDTNRMLQVAAFGVMGSALAHELSQPLSSIAAASATCQLLLRSPQIEPAEIHRHLMTVDAETGRAGRALQRIRSLVGVGRPAPRRVNLTTIVDAALELGRRLGDPAPVPVRLIKPGPIPVLADPEQLTLAIINVVRNAVEATAARGRGGSVTVTLMLGERFAKIVVDDEGPGIPPEIRDRLFEPYASTKSSGMGLGLAIARSLAELQGGRIEHDERTGDGARFVIHVPSPRDGRP